MISASIVAEVRKARETLAAKFAYDVTAILRDDQKREESLRRKVVSLERCKSETA